MLNKASRVWLYCLIHLILFGGFWGGLFGGILFLPILGLRDSCFTVAMIKLGSFSLFFLSTRLNVGTRNA